MRLEEVLKESKTDIVRDSAIKRFELCFDLACKVIKQIAKKEGLECNSPRSCFKLGFQLKLYDYDETWLDMIEDRNKSVHLYSQPSADEIYAHLPDYLLLFKKLLKNIQERTKP